MINQSGLKEPEDIFAGMDEPELQASIADSNQKIPYVAPAGSFPWKIAVTIIIPVAVVGLGVGGWYYFASNKQGAKTVQVPVNKQTQGSVPVEQVPDQKQPLDNPVPKPDETKLAASQAAMALMQAQAEQGVPDSLLEMPSSTETGTSTSLEKTGESPKQDIPSNIPLPIEQIQTALDSDQDGLSNSEELLFGTDPMQSDSDGDGFTDKSEVANGYDPAAKSSKLVDSKNLRAEEFGSLSVLVPAAWNKKPATGGTVDFLTGTPAVVNVAMKTYAASGSLLEWVLSETRGSDSADFMEERTPQGFDVIYSKDRLSAWLLAGNTVYAFRYQANGALTLDFGTIFEGLMVKQAKTIN